MQYTNTGSIQASADEIKFDEAVKALLADKYEHANLKGRLWKLVMEEGRKLPPIRVLYCTSYGEFSPSPEFWAYCESNLNVTNYTSRHDPVILQAISDYGRSLCEKFSSIHDDMRTSRSWRLSKLLESISQKKSIVDLETEFSSHLVAQAMVFFDQMANTSGHLPSFLVNSLNGGGKFDLAQAAFAICYPGFRRSHDYVSKYFGYSVQFAHILLEGNFTLYHVEPDESRNAVMYEKIGLYGASTSTSQLAIDEIPALVDYSIHEYDGKEKVVYRA